MQLIFSMQTKWFASLHGACIALRDSAAHSNRNVSMYNPILSSSLAVPMQLKFFNFLILIGSFFKCLILILIGSISIHKQFFKFIIDFTAFLQVSYYCKTCRAIICLVLKQNLNTLYLNVMSVQYAYLQCVTRYKPSVVISFVEIVWSLF